ncbi:unnamed protein product [Rodentolepis nana]|uniref:Charged multivesicular body protein 7 n=1 Tax=Rodentolepis nana TaxID=102285 RepID=A0A0R3TER5_RODNA|nr:unnamed protein product [Rodentolepis nana]
MQSLSISESVFQPPAVWNDEDEIYRLFVEIKRPRQIDPVGYNYKISFWRDLIISYAKFHRIVVITEKSLTEAFKRTFDSDGVVYKPRCLHQVLSEMMNSGLVKPVDNNTLIDNFLNAGYTWVIKKPVAWAWSLLSGEETLNEDLNKRIYGTEHTPLYLTDLVAPLCDDFLNEYKQDHDSLIMEGHVYSLEDFDEALKRFFCHTESRDFIKNQLTGRGFIKIDFSASVPLVFFLSDAPLVNFDPITLSSVARLRKLMKQITQDQQSLSNEIFNRRQKIKALVRSNRKYDALNLLRRCKQIEKELERKSQYLMQLEMLELKISAAKDNKTVLNAISEANSALKLTTGGLSGLDDAERTMDDLAANIEDQQAVSQALASPIDSLSRDIDEDKLTEELDDLMTLESELPSEEMKDSADISRLPSPPSHRVGESADEEDGILRALNSLNLNQPKSFVMKSTFKSSE